MLIKFSLGNFLSFKDLATLDLTAEGLKEKRGNLNIPYFYNPEIALLKSVCIYGHNSHGKTNLIKGYSFFRSYILGSFSAVGSPILNVEPFLLNSSMRDKPSVFEVVIVLKDTKYRYGFKVSEKCVLEEWLYYSEPKVRENVLFRRAGQEFVEVNKSWNKDSGNKVDLVKGFAREKILMLSVLAAQDGIARVDSISSWFNGNLVISNSNYETLINVDNGAGDIYSKLEYRNTILKFIKNADIGFTTIFDKISQLSHKGFEAGIINALYEKEQKRFELYTQHDIYDDSHRREDTIEFLLSKNESSGSVKYFIISCFLTKAIKDCQLIWIDELDSSLHTDLFTMIVKIYNDPKNNSTGSQLVFTTHNTIMLNKQLRRDQVIFVHKNEYGESFLRPMHSPKNPVRIEKSVEQEYREGKFDYGVSNKINRDDTPSLFD